MQLLACILAATTLSGASAQGLSDVSQIEITSRWGGLGTPGHFHVVITNEKGRFQSGHLIIRKQQVDALLQAVWEPAKTNLDLGDLGVTKEWLHAHAATVEIPRFEGTPLLTQRQRRLFQEKFTDEDVARALLTEKVFSRHTDDNPFVEAKIVGAQGTIRLVSGSQFAYMLPWHVMNGSTQHIAYNADISRALAKLLPAKATSRERLETEDLAGVLSYEVSQRFEDEINLVGVEDRTGSTLAQLRTKYTIIAADINGFHHPEYGKDWEHGDPGLRNLHVTLRRSTTPANVSTFLVLPFENGRVLGTLDFLENGDRYEQQLNKEIGLMSFIKQHQSVLARVSYVDGSSLGEKGWRTFSKDMKAIGKPELISQIEPIRNQVPLLIFGNLYAESYWMLLPDGKMLLWRYNGPSGLLGRKVSAAETKDCDSYGEFMGGCVGKVFPQP